MPSGNNACVLDSSILLAVLLEEPGYEHYLTVIDSYGELLIGAPTLAEAAAVMQYRTGPDGLGSVLRLLEKWSVRIVPFDRLHAIEAVDAARRFGKGRHPAALNMGDCNSYATAKVAGLALLYKGDDFALTDLPPLTPPAS